jgi:dienelactone hydrolase
VTALDGFTERSFTAEGRTFPVFEAGEGPSVVVMHEIPNLHPGVLRFGRRLVAEGFRVHLPSLFGVPGAPAGVRSTASALGRACVSREFTVLARRSTSPVVASLRALAREVGGSRPVGALGMCLTGGFALAMAVDGEVAAPVLSQPSLPFAVSPWHARDLGVSEEDLARVRARCADEGLCVLGLRFSHDAMAPAARFRRLSEELGEGFLAVELDASLGNPHGIPPWAHSVLGIDFVDRPDHPTRLAEDRVVAFFRQRLAPDSQPGGSRWAR